MPTLPVLVNLAKALRVSTDELLGVRSTKILPEVDGNAIRLWRKVLAIRALPEWEQRFFHQMLNRFLKERRDHKRGKGESRVG